MNQALDLCRSYPVGGYSSAQYFSSHHPMAVRLTTAIFLLYCIAYHLLAGVILLSSSAAENSTAIAGLARLFGDYQLVAGVYLLCAIVAFFSMHIRFPWNVLCLLPQQVILLIASSSIITSVIVGHFTDGVIRPRAFILADHFNVVLMAVFHAYVIILRGLVATRRGVGLLFVPFKSLVLR